MRKLPEPQMHYNTTTAKFHATDLIGLASSLAISFPDLLALILKFGTESLPIIRDALAAFVGGFSWDKLSALVTQDGPKLWLIVQEIAAAIGQTVPEPPPMESK